MDRTVELKEGHYSVKLFSVNTTFHAAYDICQLEHGCLPVIRNIEDQKAVCNFGRSWLDLRYKLDNRGIQRILIDLHFKHPKWLPEITEINSTEVDPQAIVQTDKCQWTAQTIHSEASFVCLQYITRK